jgi:hypothetical protein
MNWPDLWQKSDEAHSVDQHIVELSQPPDTTNVSTQLANDQPLKIQGGASFSRQYRYVQKRSFQLYWRSPTYIRGKVVLNLIAGLFLGFTFYKEPNSAQGLQNKMFATFTSVVLSARKF